RSLTSSSPKGSSSRILRASTRSKLSSVRWLQGTSSIQSRKLRIQPYSGLCSLILSRRSTSRSNSLRAPSGMPDFSAFARYSATTSPPPSPSCFALSPFLAPPLPAPLAELFLDGFHLLAKEDPPLVLPHALGAPAAALLLEAELGQPLLVPADQLFHPLLDVEGLQDLDFASL